MKIGAVALEELVRRYRQEDVEVAGRSAAQARFAFAGQPDARAVLDAGRDVDRQRAVARHAARAAAARHGSSITWPRPWHDGQVRSSVKKPCACANPALAAAGRAGFRLGARLGAGARARFAGDRGRNSNLRGLADDRRPRA